MFKKSYKVKLHGRSAIEYIEGDRHVVIGAEMLSGDVDMLLYSSDLLCWDPPFQEDMLTDEDRRRIMNNITSDLEKNKITVEWSKQTNGDKEKE